jgi:hypothetical protein
MKIYECLRDGRSGGRSLTRVRNKPIIRGPIQSISNLEPAVRKKVKQIEITLKGDEPPEVKEHKDPQQLEEKNISDVVNQSMITKRIQKGEIMYSSDEENESKCKYIIMKFFLKRTYSDEEKIVFKSTISW